MQPLRHGYDAGFDPECYSWPRFVGVDRDYIWIVDPILFSVCYSEPPLFIPCGLPQKERTLIQNAAITWEVNALVSRSVWSSAPATNRWAELLPLVVLISQNLGQPLCRGFLDATEIFIWQPPEWVRTPKVEKYFTAEISEWPKQFKSC